MKKLMRLVFGLVLASQSVFAFAQFGAGQYDPNQARRSEAIAMGRVVDVLNSEINVPASVATRTAAAGLAGAGCAIALQRFDSNIRWLLQGALATGCAAVGERVGNSLGSSTQSAVSYVVEIPGAGHQVVTQVEGNESLQLGQRVWVISSGGVTRIRAASPESGGG